MPSGRTPGASAFNKEFMQAVVIFISILFLAALANTFAYFPPKDYPPISPPTKYIRFIATVEKIAVIRPEFKVGWTIDRALRPSGEKLFIMTESALPEGAELRIHTKGEKK